NAEKGKGVSRSPFKTFSLRKRRCNEGAVLGLSRSKNPQAHIPLPLDPTSQRRCTGERHDLQPPGRRTEGCRHRTGPQNSRRPRGHRRSRIQIDCRPGASRAGEEKQKGGVIRKSKFVNRDSISRFNDVTIYDSRNPCTRSKNCAMTRCANSKLH